MTSAIPPLRLTAQPQNPAAPPQVSGLAADVGQTRVRLTWNPANFPVAGYFVERHAISGPAGTENWVRLNSRVTPEPLYDDPIGLASGVNLEYRVVAVAFDNAEGPPSNTVPVALADRTVPEAPSITGASGADGKAQLNFVPALPAEKTAQFLVLRSGSDRDLGVVIGDPLPAAARQFTDLYTSPGERYWYRLVAVDKKRQPQRPHAPGRHPRRLAPHDRAPHAHRAVRRRSLPARNATTPAAPRGPQPHRRAPGPGHGRLDPHRRPHVRADRHRQRSPRREASATVPPTWRRTAEPARPAP